MKSALTASHALVICAALCLLAGCRSMGGRNFFSPVENDYSLERIGNLLDEGENLRALPLIFSRIREGDESLNLYQKALSGLEAEWKAAREDGDWRRSLSYLRSFGALDESAIAGGISETDLYLEGVRAYLDAGYAGAAAALLQSNVNLEDLDESVREELAEVFEQSGHRSLTARLRGDAPPPSPGMAPLIDGTVTVWVNRGIRLVGNVGVPDRGIGSGFFVDGNGYLLTNYHVIESEVDPAYQGYSRLFIKIDDESGDRVPARVIGWEKNLDLALLKTEIDVPYVFSFAENALPALGERITAIGSPGGLTRTLTSGTVSAYERSLQPMSGSLQIDVPINPGNSGGPLLNIAGEVIGIVFAGIQEYDGINFAVPGPFALNALPLLFDGGQVEVPWLGLSAWDSSGKILVTYVVPGSPAAEAGLQAGDHILSIDGQTFSTIRSVQAYLLGRRPGTITSLLWKRDDEPMESIAALGVRPEIPLKTALSRDAREHLLTPLFGFTMERISGRGFYQNFRVESVLSGSIADEAGFSAGDSISLKRWIYDEELDIVAVQLILRGRKAGFLESAIQIGAYLNINTVM